MKPARILSFLLAFLLIWLMTACSQLAAPEIPAEPTPPAATPTLPPLPTKDNSEPEGRMPDGADVCVTAFLTALSRNDAGAMIDATMCDDLCDNLTYSFGSHFAGTAQGLSNMKPLMRHSNEFICSLLSNVDLADPIPDFSEDEVRSFIAYVDPARFKRLEVVALAADIIPPSQAAQVLDFMTSFGVSDIAIRYALITVEGVHFFQKFIVGRFGDSYRIIDLGMPDERGYVTGLAQYTTKNNFLSLFTEENLAAPPFVPNAASSSDVYEQLKNITIPALPSPDDAVLYYADALARQDFYAALSATSFRHEANTFDLAAMTEYIKVFQPGESGMPSEYSFYTDLNLVTKAAEKANALYLTRLCFALDFDNLSDAPTQDVIIRLFKSSDADISSLTVKRSDIIARTKDENYQSLSKRRQDLYAADAMDYRIIQYLTNEKEMVGALSFLRIGNEWRIFDNENVFLNTTPYTPVIPADLLDYNSLI